MQQYARVEQMILCWSVGLQEKVDVNTARWAGIGQVLSFVSMLQ